MEKSFKKLSLLLGIAGSIAFSCNLYAADEKEGIVKGSYINVRSEPKFNSQIIGKKLRGDTYIIKSEQQNWLKVVFKDSTEGWIYRTLIETSSATDNVKPNDSVDTSKTNEESKNASKDNKKASKTETKKTQAKTSKTDTETKDNVKPLIKKEKVPEVVETSGTAEDLYNDAIKLYEKRRYSEALEKNLAASKKAPQNAEILNNLANCQFKLGRLEDSLASWKAALKIAPRSGKICNNLGIAYYQLDRNKDSIEYYKKAILFEPDFADPYYNIACVYGFIGEFEEAIKNYKKFLEFNPDDTMKNLTDEKIAYCEKQLRKITK